MAQWPITCDRVYLRLLGDLSTKFGPGGTRNYVYDHVQWSRHEAMLNWAAKIRQSGVKKAFIYVNNHFEGFAPATVSAMATALGQRIELPTHPDDWQKGDGIDTEQLRLFEKGDLDRI